MAIYMTAWFATLTLASDPKYSKMCWSKSWGIFAPFKTLPILVGNLKTPPFLAKGTHGLQTPIFPKGTFFRDHPNCWPWKESQKPTLKGTFQRSSHGLDWPTLSPSPGMNFRLWGLYFFGACHVDLSEGWASHRTDTTCASSGLAVNALSRCASGGSSNSSHLVEELWGDGGGGLRGCFVSCVSYFFGFCLVGEILEHWRLRWEGRKQESCIWPPEIGCSKAVSHYYVILATIYLSQY